MDSKTPTIVIYIEFEITKGKLEEFLEGSKSLIEETHKESGCLKYDMNNLASNPHKFVLYEEWTSKEDLSSHLKSEHFEKAKSIFAMIAPGTWKANSYEIKGIYKLNL